MCEGSSGGREWYVAIKSKDTYRMISGGSCCQDLLDSFPLYCEVGGDIRAVYASVARVVTLIRRR